MVRRQPDRVAAGREPRAARLPRRAHVPAHLSADIVPDVEQPAVLRAAVPAARHPGVRVAAAARRRPRGARRRARRDRRALLLATLSLVGSGVARGVSARSTSGRATCTGCRRSSARLPRAGPSTSSCYNLQFTGFHWALNADVRGDEADGRDDDRISAVQPLGPLVAARRAARSNAWPAARARSRPDYADEAMIAALRRREPRELWLVEQPNDGDTLAVQTAAPRLRGRGLRRGTRLAASPSPRVIWYGATRRC